MEEKFIVKSRISMSATKESNIGIEYSVDYEGTEVNLSELENYLNSLRIMLLSQKKLLELEKISR